MSGASCAVFAGRGKRGALWHPRRHRRLMIETHGDADAVTLLGFEQAASRFHDDIGDESTWRRKSPQYQATGWPPRYEAIDVHTFGQRDDFEHRFVIASGADRAPIAVRGVGVEGIAAGMTGNVLFTECTTSGTSAGGTNNPRGSEPAFLAKIGTGALLLAPAEVPHNRNEGASVAPDASPPFDPDEHPLRCSSDLSNGEKKDLITLACRQIPRPRARYLYSEETESCRGQTG